MSARAVAYTVWFLAAAGLHAGVLFGWGKVFATRVDYAVSAGQSVELTLIEAAGEPPSEVASPPEPPPPEPPQEAPPESEPPPRQEAEMIQPQPEPEPRPKPASAPRAMPRTARSAPLGAPSAGGVAGLRTKAKPNYLSNPPPAYPAASKQAGEQGVVMLSVSVTEQGRAASVRLERSSGFPRLDEAARNAVQRWRFSPARLGSIAVSSEVTVPVRFHLK